MRKHNNSKYAHLTRELHITQNEQFSAECTNTVGGFSTPLSMINKITRQQIEVIDIRLLHPIAKYTFFSSACKIINKIDCNLGKERKLKCY